MMDFDKFFDAFPGVSKEAWLEQIKKDLKGRALEELNWQAETGLQVSPFVHADDFNSPLAPLSAGRSAWEICENVPVEDPVAANNQAMEALQGGAEGLCFSLDHLPDAAALDQVFAGIHLDFIGLHFAGAAVRQSPAGLAGLLQAAFTRHGHAGASLRGSIHFDPFNENPRLIDWRYIADYVAYCGETLPEFRLISLPIPVGDSAIESLAITLQHANTCLQQLAAKGINASTLPGLIQFVIPTGKSYFLEIAKIRAFKLLWINLLKAQGLPLSYPALEARLNPDSFTDDLYTNMIRGTTMAMSAVTGGVNRLIVTPYDAGREAAAVYPPAFGRRIARNVQQLMKMESHLEENADVAAGSYYVETLTRQLAEKAWERFTQL